MQKDKQNHFQSLNTTLIYGHTVEVEIICTAADMTCRFQNTISVHLNTKQKHKPVFLFSILEMGARPSELGKFSRKLWKLGKVETYKKFLKLKRI